MERAARTILIVEDEERIAQLIRRLIHLEELGLSCTGIAKNGQEGYETIMKDRPDIVITDIRMPRINGLDLIEMVRQQLPEVRFIVLSGYKEFEYAHRALQYEVDGYLLKPINEAELNETLGRIVGMLDAREEADQAARKMQQEVKESRQIIRRDFLREILEMEESGALDELSEDGAFPVEMTGDLFRAIDIKLDNQNPETENRREEKQIATRVTAIVEKNLEACAQEVLCCEKEALHIYALFNYRSECSKDIRAAISQILSQIKEYLLRFEQYEATIGIGGAKEQFSETRLSIREANRAAGNRIGLGSGRLIYAENLAGGIAQAQAGPGSSPEAADSSVLRTSPVKNAAAHLQALMEARNHEEVSRGIRQLFDEVTAAEQVDYSICYTMAEELIALLYDWMEGEEGELAKKRRQIRLRCQNLNQISALRDCLIQEYTRCLIMMEEADRSESSKPVRIAKTYMEEHYSEKIVLEDLAALVDLNPVYFSVLFKKETDMNISSYLKQIRMEKAKELLRTTNETIAAIGDSVGYRDSRHFSQSFTKYVGVKPALYRRLHS